MIEILIAGAAFGLSAGLSPGPMLALVVSEAAAKGRAAGLAIAAAPLLSDGPIIAASIYLLGRVEDSQAALGILSLVGGGLLASYGISGLRIKPYKIDEEPRRLQIWQSLGKGVAANFLNPNPYLFWLTIGTPLLLRADAASRLVAALFLVLFYIGLVGSKAVLAVLVARSRSVITGPGYLWVNRILALVLLVYAALFIRDGLSRLMGV